MEKKKKIALIVGIIAVVGGAIGAVITLMVRKCMREMDEMEIEVDNIYD